MSAAGPPPIPVVSFGWNPDVAEHLLAEARQEREKQLAAARAAAVGMPQWLPISPPADEPQERYWGLFAGPLPWPVSLWLAADALLTAVCLILALAMSVALTVMMT